jgi:hypothetical protein
MRSSENAKQNGGADVIKYKHVEETSAQCHNLHI